MLDWCSDCCWPLGFLGIHDQGQEISHNSISILLLSRLSMEHTQHDLQSSSREVGKHQVLLSRGPQESVLPSRPSLDTQWNHPLCQASSSSGQGHQKGIAENVSENLHSRVQVTAPVSGGTGNLCPGVTGSPPGHCNIRSSLLLQCGGVHTLEI